MSQVPSSNTAFSLCHVCVHIPLLYKDTSPYTEMTYTDPISKERHILRHWGLGLGRKDFDRTQFNLLQK